MTKGAGETTATKATSPAKSGGKANKHALVTEPVAVDSHCVGDRWTVEDEDRLARLIAVIAMGQASHAAQIIVELRPAEAAISDKALKEAAKLQLSITGTTANEQDASRWRRDGFIFEVISWIAARQTVGADVLMKAPHLKSTTQGIDGLMVELNAEKSEVIQATIFEDKCSESPRTMFRDQIMPAFADHHANKRAPELVAVASELIEKAGLDGSAATAAAARILDKKFRRYRAALAVLPTDDTKARREALFKNYDDLKDMKQTQRVGVSFITKEGHRIHRCNSGWDDLMFDPVTAKILQAAPPLEGLNPESLPALLTRQYAQLVARRLRGIDTKERNLWVQAKPGL